LNLWNHDSWLFHNISPRSSHCLHQNRLNLSPWGSSSYASGAEGGSKRVNSLNWPRAVGKCCGARIWHEELARIWM
jgi:hypothetical protein